MIKVGEYEVEPIEVVDRIDDCNWSEWSCNIYKPDGTVIENGSIQGDGHCWAHETLTDDAGNKLV
jgi:hypothetical protein